jgi:hypothetical protein
MGISTALQLSPFAAALASAGPAGCLRLEYNDGGDAAGLTNAGRLMPECVGCGSLGRRHALYSPLSEKTQRLVEALKDGLRGERTLTVPSAGTFAFVCGDVGEIKWALAAMQFERNKNGQVRPTYTSVLGAAGASITTDIAANFLPPEIIAHARELMAQ